MKNIGIFTNLRNDKDLKITRKVKLWCELNEVKYKLFHDCDENKFYENIDGVVVIGGDGTVLRVASTVSKLKIDVVGINAGKLGYLTTIEIDEIDEALDKIKNGDFRKIEHIMISTVINGTEFTALNEICFKSNNNELIKVHMYINGQYINTYRADGVLVTTPTGSTAYNLSCGGPIILENTEVLCITPICSHNFFEKPIIVNGDNEIKLVLDKEGVNKNIAILVDGNKVNKDYDIEEILVVKSKIKLNTVNPFMRNFHEILLDKLRKVNR